MTSEKVKKYWDQVASNKSLAKCLVTSPDICLKVLEVELIKRFLSPNDKVLDLGCGNGWVSHKISDRVKSVIGVDFSVNMITRALEEHKIYNTNFYLGNMLKLDFKPICFDKVISVRSLQNLTSFEDQMIAITEVYRVLKPGGIYIMIEGSKEGRDNINSLRESLKLEHIPNKPFNLHFNNSVLKSFLMIYFYKKEKISFGIYDLISKVVYPMTVFPAKPDYCNELNNIASSLNYSITNKLFKFSRQIMYVLEKI